MQNLAIPELPAQSEQFSKQRAEEGVERGVEQVRTLQISMVLTEDVVVVLEVFKLLVELLLTEMH